MPETINYGLYIEDDNSVFFKDWRKKMNGTDDSNMVKIDAILKKLSEADVIGIATEENSESGGLNKVTFALATGEVIDFIVRNGNDGIGIRSIVQTTASNTDGGENVITITLTDNSTNMFSVKNGNRGSDGLSFGGILYDKDTNKWSCITTDNSNSYESSFDGPTIPQKVTDLNDANEYYKREYIDSMFDGYIKDVAVLIGGDA